MVDPVATLPEPISEDTEDIVKLLEGAKSQWARGQHAAAIGSIRKAAEVAMAAGQHFRSTELSMSVSEIEDALAEAAKHSESNEKAARPPPPPPATARAPSGVPNKLSGARVPTPSAGMAAAHPAPMLDPWSDMGASPAAAAETPEPRRENVARERVKTDDNVVVVEMRARPAPARRDDEDENVMTSAAPLHEMLKRKAVPPPPPSSARAVPQAAPSPSSARAAPQAAPPPPPPSIPKASPAPAAPPASEPEAVNEPPPRPSFADLSLSSVPGLRGLPTETRELLTEVARIEELTPGKRTEVSGAALVITGQAGIAGGTSQVPAMHVERGTLVPARGTLGRATKLSLIGGSSGATVALWNDAVLDTALKASSWIHEELCGAADNFQAAAGAMLGPLGELPEIVRQGILDRLSVRVVRPQEIIVEQGHKLTSLLIVGAGALELVKGDPARVTGEVSAGDFLFPGIVVRDLTAPATVRGGVHGAVVLSGDQPLARSILTGDAPVIGILSA